VPGQAGLSTLVAPPGRARPRVTSEPGGRVGHSKTAPTGADRADASRKVQQAAPKTTTSVLPLGERAGGAGLISPSRRWEGGALNVGTILSVPATLAGLAAVFFVLQWLIDHRDPRFLDAPLRKDEDSVGFD
jgi:hypothetical protein